VKIRKPYSIGGMGLLGLCMGVGVAQAQTTPAQSQELEEIIVTGFRQSLQNSTDAKREAVGFVDSIFAEDMGKFPDTNIAESFNRIPGITITREITGEGLNIAIRGLGTNFTRVLLNNAPIAIASTGRTDSQSTNREVDLDLFPTELFSQLTVSKSPSAGMLEGGAAGTVNMRSARPFDNPGANFTYSAQAIDYSNADDLGGRASMVLSNTWGAFGALVGVAGVRSEIRTTGFETIGWTNPNLTADQCGAGATCNTYGGGNWTIPGAVPDGAGNGLTPGTTIDRDFLLANNPGLTIEQIDNAIIPRLGRPMEETGTKERYNAIVSLEFRPSDELNFYLDSMYGKKENDLERIDMNWVVRNGAIIPLNMTVDRDDCSEGCVVTSGTFANAEAFLEYRPFIEDVEFWGTNPGMMWQITDALTLDVQGNYTKSEFRRESPTLLVSTGLGSGMTVNYTNDGGVPVIGSNVDLNNPASFGWAGGRLNLQNEERETETKGVRADLTWGDTDLNLRFGAAYDEVSRNIVPFDNSGPWQNAACGNNPNVELPGPNQQPPCSGLNQPGTTPPAGFPAYPGYGSNFSAGFPPLEYLGSLVPQSALAGYLRPGPGFITANWNSFARDSNYDFYNANAPDAGGSNTGAGWGIIEETTTGLYTEINGDTAVGDNRLRYNVGVRWVETEQAVGSRISRTNPLNTPLDPLADFQGGLYPNVVTYEVQEEKYENWLPSANVALNITDNVVVRVGASRTMTRANPNTMRPGLSFTSPSADTGSLGNPDLDPFLSDNIDLGFEYYTGNEGYFGVAAFRKGIEGFTVTEPTTVPFSSLAAFGITYDTLGRTQQTAIDSRGGPNVATVVLNQQVNAPGRLTVNGLEFNWVQPLDFLLSGIGLEGLGFTANYTIIDQKGEGAAPAVATGVAPETYNATLYYENYGVSARISTTFAEGAQNSGPGGQNGIPTAELFGDDYQQWDFSSSFDFGEIFDASTWVPQLTVDVINLTKEKQRSYFQFTNATFSLYDPGRTVIVGLRGRF
jgi:TonB-dependent receptor